MLRKSKLHDLMEDIIEIWSAKSNSIYKGQKQLADLPPNLPIFNSEQV